MRHILVLAALASLVSCGAPQTASIQEASVSTNPATPRGIVRTDGHEAVSVAFASSARCEALNSSEAARALDRTNAVRAAEGLPMLRVNSKLQKAAEQQACDMAGRGVMDHRGVASTGPGMRVKQLGYRPRITAENIAAGSASLFDLEGVLHEWATSARHRENMVIPQMREMGIGRAYSADGRHAYWSVVYSAPK
ncbi:CAP domain-containing protein [Paracoccus sp. MBLB3053]|uniref:CAP domain-containing protein n=1 Tax=Paracoccus aurantius TaxID=3073814 RepID=A0ABU2HN61_9RHOB|nr:CAP domain-containing protein [Paracoccus sp. MBLB3053]MDS9466471.1 CAP domain-containing protein [Paracoccus sp. MBLB3053]